MRSGFSSLEDPGGVLDPRLPLLPGRDYLFWVEIGPPVPSTPADRPPGEQPLEVAIFAYPVGLQPRDGRLGRVALQPNGVADTRGHGTVPPRLPADSVALRRRVYFRVRTPDREGDAPLRWGIYTRQVLLQSYVERVQVRRRPRPTSGARSSVRDYVLAKALRPAHVAAVTQHRLSILVNRNDDGTHSLFFFGRTPMGDQQVTGTATMPEGMLQGIIGRLRGELRRTSWGTDQEWSESDTYRYDGAPDLARLREDLIRQAIWGYRAYARIRNSLALDTGDADTLRALMRTPGLLQIAAKESAAFYLPAALLYDYDFDTNATDLDLCPVFLDAVRAPDALDACPCFRGQCPSIGVLNRVCPSGFWGYRHRIGLPVSLPRDKAGDIEVETQLVHTGSPAVLVAVSTDQRFTGLDAHVKQLQGLFPPPTWNYADSREQCLTLLKTALPHIVYFFCHFGMYKGAPFIQVGKIGEGAITGDNLLAYGIAWKNPRPLVMVNGCRSTALEPDQALDLVTDFVATAGAAGVIGTEITVFEPLARAFAEQFLRRFRDAVPVGEAIRSARLHLLQLGNPLGLAYVPFVIAGLHLDRASPPASVPGTAAVHSPAPARPSTPS